MRKGVILTLPCYDIVTEYLSAFSQKIKIESEKKGVFLKLLNKEKANKKEFEKVVNKLDCKLIVFNGHGSDDSIKGDKGEVLVKLGKNDSILKNRIVYARSCEAAYLLGRASVKNSNGCFIGYDLPFEFYFNSEWAANPIKDNFARPFLESSNLVPISLIKGNSSLESHERARKQMLKNIKKILRSKTQEAFFIAESLWNNYLGQVILGNQKAIL